MINVRLHKEVNTPLNCGNTNIKENNIKKIYIKTVTTDNNNNSNQKSLESKAITIIKKLTEAGYKAYYTGGWVRDYILNFPSSDIDIVTNAPKEKIVGLYPKVSLEGQNYGVYVVDIEGDTFEIANFREDGNYSNGRRPNQVSLASIQTDALRRDLTINGLYFNPLNNHIIDFVGGVEDVKNGVVKTIGNPSVRFDEDRIRMLRTVRFAARFGFKIEPETEQAIIKYSTKLFPALSKTIVFKELHKMVEYPNFQEALVELLRLNLLPTIFPSLKNVSLETIKERVRSFPLFPQNSPLVLYLMELFPDMSLEEQKNFCDNYKLSKYEFNLLKLTHSIRNCIYREMNKEKVESQEWVQLLSDPQFELCFAIALAREPDTLRAEIEEKCKELKNQLQPHIERIKNNKHVLDSKFIISKGFEKKSIRLLIEEADRLAIQHNLTDPAKVFELLKQSPVCKSAVSH